MTTGVFHVPGATGGGRYRNHGHQAVFRQKLLAMRDIVSDEMDVTIPTAGYRAGFESDASSYRAWAVIRYEFEQQGWGRAI